MPVYRETLDAPTGMIHIKDLLTWIAAQAEKNGNPPKSESAEPRPALSSAPWTCRSRSRPR